MTVSFDQESLREICRQNNVSKLSLFGSLARGEATEASDIDLLVEFSTRKSLLDLVELEQTMTERLGRKVDLLTPPALSPYLRERILAEAQVIYAA